MKTLLFVTLCLIATPTWAQNSAQSGLDPTWQLDRSIQIPELPERSEGYGLPPIIYVQPTPVYIEPAPYQPPIIRPMPEFSDPKPCDLMTDRLSSCY